MLAARIALLREWLESGETAWLHVTGDSMRPLLPPGSRIQLSRVSDRALRRGAMIVYEIEDRLVCHRLLVRRGAGPAVRLVARGDAWRAVNAWVGGPDVVGVVVAVDRRDRVVRLDTPRRRRAAAGLALGSLVVAWAVGVARRLKRSCAGASGWAPAA